MSNQRYKIVDITDLSGKTRTDGRYPMRIGSTVTNLSLAPGICMSYDYVLDNKKEDKNGHFRTSWVHKIILESSGLTTVITCNSIYTLEEIV